MRRAAGLLAALALMTAGCGTTSSVSSSGTAPTTTTRPATTTSAADVTTSAADALPPPDPALPPALRRLPHGPATVWAVGDGADGGAPARALARRVVAARPALFLYLGDVYETGSAGEFATAYRAVYGALDPRTAPTPGNHEWDARASGYDPYWARALGGTLPPWYAVRIAGWQLLSLNSEAPHDAGGEQVRWLRRQVRGTSTCRLAFWHRPRFNAGLHGDQRDVAPLWETLRGRAVLVLNGHDHSSQRLHPRDGITELVAGGGGHLPYPVNPLDRRLAFASTGDPAALRLRLRPGRADVAFVDVHGAVLDHTTVRCRASGSRG